MASLLASGEAPSSRWDGPRREAVSVLTEELHGQVLADGTHYERSPSYHCQVFADLLECRQALGDDPLNGALDDALARMAQAAVDLSHPDGQVALFNDAGLSMAYSPAECLDAYARLYGQRPAPRAIFALEDAGYFGLRSDATYLLVDCGRIAPDEFTRKKSSTSRGSSGSIEALDLFGYSLINQGEEHEKDEIDGAIGDNIGTARLRLDHAGVCAG